MDLVRCKVPREEGVREIVVMFVGEDDGCRSRDIK